MITDKGKVFVDYPLPLFDRHPFRLSVWTNACKAATAFQTASQRGAVPASAVADYNITFERGDVTGLVTRKETHENVTKTVVF